MDKKINILTLLVFYFYNKLECMFDRPAHGAWIHFHSAADCRRDVRMEFTALLIPVSNAFHQQQPLG